MAGALIRKCTHEKERSQDDKERRCHLQAKKSTLRKNQPCQHLNLKELLASRLQENKFMLSKPPNR